MDNKNINITLPVNLNQIIEIIKQLSYRDKLELTRLLEEETRQHSEKDELATHLASEKVLAKDWLRPEEDEAWKDL